MSLAVATPCADQRGDLKSLVLKRAAEFTMIPAAAMKAMEVGRNPACSVKEYAGAIESDVRLTADILSMANSSLHSTGNPAATLRDAVMRLGLRRCQNLILSTCTAGLMKNLPLDQSNCRERLWKHSYMTAVICRHINQEMSLGFQGEEFTAGLMHDLGRSLLAAIVPEEFAAIEGLESEECANILEREREILNTDHCELGAGFAAKSGLPPALVATIYHHHAPSGAKEHGDLVTLVAVADHMAIRLESLQLGDACDAASNPFLPFLSDADRAQRALESINSEFAQRAATEALRLIA